MTAPKAPFNQENIRSEILSILSVKDNTAFSSVDDYFTNIDHYALRKIVKEMAEKGYVIYDSEKWDQNIIALKITGEGRYFLQNKDTGKSTYQKRTWLIAVGAIGSMAFAFALALNVYFGNEYTSDTFKADILPQTTAENVLKIYLKQQNDDITHYVIKLKEETENKKIYEIECKQNIQCLYENKNILIEKLDGGWKLTKIY